MRRNAVSRRSSPLLLALVLAAVAPAAAQAAFPGRNGKVAYSDGTVGAGDVMVADANGTVNVSNDPGSESTPRWSPDGTRLVWLRMVPNSQGGQVAKVIVANADGSGQRQLTSGDSDEGSPSWSPDGRSIAYRSILPPPTNSVDVYVVNADGTGTPRRVTDSATTGINYDKPVWAPDGSSIAAIAGQPFGPQLGIVLIDPGTGTTRPLTGTAGDDSPAWSPDGRTVAFVRSNALYGVPAAGGTAQLMVTPQGVISSVPFWTPDGTHVGFWDNGGAGVVAYMPDGTDQRVIAATGWPDVDWQPCSGECHPLAGLDSPVTAAPAAPTGQGATGSQATVGTPGAPVTALPPPVAGRTANVAPVRGQVLVRLPGTARFAPLTGAAQIPVGAAVDTTKGTVRLVSARPGGGTQTADFKEGVFAIQQSRTSPRVDLQLTGALACARRARAAKRKRRRAPVTRHLWGDGKGQFRTVGRYSAAAVRGTRWLVEDRCDGTLTRVARGVVSVRDFVRRRTVTVRAGHSYLARRR